MSADVRAATITSPRQVQFSAQRLRSPAPGEVRVAVQGCGICGSNVPVWEGRPWFSYPLEAGAPGHEAWGVVEAVGDGVSDVAPGDAVALLTSRAFAEAVVVPSVEAVVLPAALSGSVFPGEALGCGFNVARRSAFAAGTTVAVVGIGFIGAIVTALAAAAGARVIAIGRRESSLEVARAMGAAHTIPMHDHQRVLDEVGALTGGSWCEVVVEAVGAQWPLDLASALTGVGGRLVVAGYHQDGARTVDMQLWNWRGIDVVNAHERDTAVIRRGVLEAAHAVVDGSFDPSPLYSHQFGFDRLGEAMDAIVDRPGGFMKSLVTM